MIRATTKSANLEIVPWLIGNWMGRNGKLRAPNNKTLQIQKSLEVRRPTPHRTLHLKYLFLFLKSDFNHHNLDKNIV